MIGLFDSGSGGLSVLTALRKKAPDADILYFGDIANAPYGEKTENQLTTLTRNGIRILKKRGIDSLVSACNSISTSILAGTAGTLPCIEMSLPTAQYLKQYSGKRFLLIATPATIASRLYEKATKGIISLDSLPIPNLAGAIEFEQSENEMEQMLTKAFSSKAGHTYDYLILGCTHYPLVRVLIEKTAQKYFGVIEVIDPAYPVADAVYRMFDIQGNGRTHFLISQSSEAFERKVSTLFPNSSYVIDCL